MEGELQGACGVLETVCFLTIQEPCRLLGMEAFLCPLFLVSKERTPASMTFPEFQREDLDSC